MILTVTLNPALDRFYILRHFQPGTDHRPQAMLASAGGKGINVARALKNLGVPSMITGFIGGNAGQEIESLLRAQRIPYDFVAIPGNSRMTQTMVAPGQEVTRIIETGPVIGSASRAMFLRKYQKLLHACHTVVFSGSLMPGLEGSFYRRLIVMAQQQGKKTVLDTSQAALVSGLKAKPHILKLNREEAESVWGRRLRRNSEVVAAIRWLLRRGVCKVIISLGPEGAIGSEGKDIVLAAAPVMKCHNTVGCGDALLAGFLSAEKRREKFADALSWAVAAGTANCLGLIPGNITRSVLGRIQKNVKLKITKKKL